MYSILALHENAIYFIVNKDKKISIIFSWSVLAIASKGRTIIFLEGGGIKNIEKNCLQRLKRQNKLFANIICI